MIGLVLGGLALLLLLVVGGVVLAINSADDETSPSTTSFTLRPTTTGFATGPTSTAAGPTTSVAGTGPTATVTAADAEGFLKEQQQKVLPDVPVGTVTCPPEPYRVGHVIICRLVLQGTPVLYRVEITGIDFLQVKPTRPIIDNDKAEVLVEQNEVGAQADCGSPRIRQVDVGAAFSCRTATSSWDFTVRDENGQVAGTRR